MALRAPETETAASSPFVGNAHLSFPGGGGGGGKEMASGPLPPDDVLRAWLSGSVGDDAVAPDTKPTRHQLLRDDQSRQQEMDRIEQIVRSEMARKAGGNDAKRER
eukprot:Sspe_Gene.15166::Locus_5263_Transcript_1_1_Confidence_1.000_Length_651::g.15166::m.15166